MKGEKLENKERNTVLQILLYGLHYSAIDYGVTLLSTTH